MEVRPLLKIWVKTLVKTYAKIRGKFTQNHLDHAKQSATDALKTASKRAIQKRAEETDDLIRNKISEKITKVSKALTE